MALTINSNIASLNAQRNLATSSASLGSTYRRLSSGLRINSSADDAAGLAISDRMASQIRGFNQSISDANDTVSLIQVADSALSQTTDDLQRMRELSVQAANDTNITSDRKDMQLEMNQLVQEIDRLANNTQFNNQHLLQGSFGLGKQFQVGANTNQTITVTIQSMGANALGMNSGQMLSFGAGTTGSANQAAAESAIQRIDNAIGSVTSMRATLGAMQNRFTAAITSMTSMSTNVSSAKAAITDADMASETANMTKNSILQQAGAAVLAQANQQPSIVLTLLK
ncbi:MAG: flagellin FliC [Magnetococcales bacterium]|nr:flagellin FliC [Magnetococcales bacterium]